MSSTSISLANKLILWGKAAGRCQYCNKPLFTDALTRGDFNQAYIAHIIADAPNGPRGDVVLSPLLANDLSNLMLLCDAHHRLIDKIDIAGHPVDYLRKMKADHEVRIQVLTEIEEEKRSHIILYGAKIGTHDSPLNYKNAAIAMIPENYPASERPIELGIKNSVMQDHQSAFWSFQEEQLMTMFQQQVYPLKQSDSIQHFSVFALGPMPLLIKLGTLLNDIYIANVFQRSREPVQSWKWLKKKATQFFKIIPPSDFTAQPVLKITLSASINDERLNEVVGNEVSVWTLTCARIGKDCIKSKSDLSRYRDCVRLVLNEIKVAHGEQAKILVFPAMPVSCAVELGRVWMPKADLPLVIYDQNRTANRFIETLTIQ